MFSHRFFTELRAVAFKVELVIVMVLLLRFDLVVVLRCSTDALWSRLEQRHYTEAKIKENVECEIFQTVCYTPPGFDPR